MAARKPRVTPAEVAPGQQREAVEAEGLRTVVLVGAYDEARKLYSLYRWDCGEWRDLKRRSAVGIQRRWPVLVTEGNRVPAPLPRPKPGPDWRTRALKEEARRAELEQALTRAQVVCRDLDRMLGEVLTGGA